MIPAILNLTEHPCKGCAFTEKKQRKRPKRYFFCSKTIYFAKFQQNKCDILLEKLLDRLLKRTRIETEINVYSYINAVNNRLSCKQGIAETRSATLPTSRRWITASVPLDRNKIRAVICVSDCESSFVSAEHVLY